MEPKFNTSFIPKKPVVETQTSATVRGSGQKNIFSILATVMFIVAILALGGLFVYKKVLNSQITAADQEVNAARDAFQTQKIQDLLDANSRIMATKKLLDSHTSISALFALLQNVTVKSVQYTKLTYDASNAKPILTIIAEARSYNALASLSDLMAKSDFITFQDFSDFSLAENGNVKVSIFANVDPTLTSYKRAVNSLSAAQ